MNNLRQIMLAASLLLMGSVLLTLGTLTVAQAADKDLGEAEIYKMESGSKDFVIDLIAAGIWTKDCDEYQQFNKYKPEVKLYIPKYNETTEEFEDTNILSITGAEYRRAFVSAKAFANVAKLDEDGQKRVNTEFFGQETKPEKGTDEFIAGIDKAKNLLYLILGESFLIDATAERSSNE